jgi:glycerophosphoryl diester phosphodiesterase
MTRLPYRNKIAVAGHRGNAKFFPENTMAGFRSAVSLKPDMIEMDVHMTKDRELIVMHDHKVNRTTDGDGAIRDLTFEQIRKLDAGSWKGEEFRGEKVPAFEEFLALMAENPDIMLNVELKDYPSMSGPFAYESAERAIAMMDRYGVTERSVVNSWSGELNEWISEKYGDRIRIHAYHPQELMGANQKRFVYDYAYCVCLFSTWKGASVVPKQMFDFALSYGVEPWVFYSPDTPEVYDAAVENGAILFTSNDPAWAMEYLRSKGLHD